MKGERRKRRGGQVPFWLVRTTCSAGRRRRRWGMARGRTTPYFFAPNVCKLLKGLPPPPTKRRRRRRKQRGWMIGGPPHFIAARFTSQQTWPTKQLATGLFIRKDPAFELRKKVRKRVKEYIYMAPNKHSKAPRPYFSRKAPRAATTFFFFLLFVPCFRRNAALYPPRDPATSFLAFLK